MAIRRWLRPVLLGVIAVGCWAALREARAASSTCPGDFNNDGSVTVNEIILAVNAALDGCPTPGPTQSCGLQQTGQTECDQGSGTLDACPGSPLGQDAAVGAGVPLSYTDNGDGTITDNVTGLMWEKLSDDGLIHDKDTTYTWADAFAVKILALDSTPCFAGHCDWRLPNRRELESIVDEGRTAPAVDPAFNNNCKAGCKVTACSCVQLDSYWSSTTYTDIPSFAWGVDCNVGSVNGFEKATALFYVRAVRGGL